MHQGWGVGQTPRTPLPPAYGPALRQNIIPLLNYTQMHLSVRSVHQNLFSALAYNSIEQLKRLGFFTALFSSVLLHVVFCSSILLSQFTCLVLCTSARCTCKFICVWISRIINIVTNLHEDVCTVNLPQDLQPSITK